MRTKRPVAWVETGGRFQMTGASCEERQKGTAERVGLITGARTKFDGLYCTEVFLEIDNVLVVLQIMLMRLKSGIVMTKMGRVCSSYAVSVLAS
jgi:hypothetical protein